MQICNIRCFHERLRLDWSSVVMATELSNQQNALIPNDLQYITAIFRMVCGGGMNTTAPLPHRGSWGRGLIFFNHLEPSGMFSTVIQAVAARRRLHSKSE